MTERLVLRPVCTDDLDGYRALGIRLEAARREVEYAAAHWAEHGFGPWAILEHGYYEQPGVWNFTIDTDKRVMAEIVASLSPERVLVYPAESAT